LLAGVAIASACALASGCSSSPSPYPAIFSDPPPRADMPPMTPDQVKQAMSGLNSDHDRLCSQAAATDPPDGLPAGCPPQTTASVTPAAGGAAKP
jgi:hypothetical protein